MSFWSDLFSKKEDLANEPDVRKETANAPLVKDEIVSPNVSYDQFEKEPGKSVSLLNNDPAWNRFVQFESDNDEELVARFKRKEFENYVLNAAYKKGLIRSKIIEQCVGYKLDITVNEIITTYQNWANKEEPIIKIIAMILNNNLPPGQKCCVFEYSYLVRAPFVGYLSVSSFFQEHDKEGGRMYQLYTANRARVLWPKMPTDFIYDDIDRLSRVHMNFNECIYDEHFRDDFPFWDWEAEGKLPCLR